MDLQIALDHRTEVEEFQRKHRIGLLTLLFTDIAGSAQIKQSLGDRKALALFQRHTNLVWELLGRFPESEVIGTAGDSFFIVFAKPSEAVKFSLLLQSRLGAMEAELPRPIHDRIGVHVGEVFIAEEEGRSKDLYGLQVDICARVLALGRPHQVMMTRFAFDSARQVLRGQDFEGVGALSWVNHGCYQLKGVEEPMEICAVAEESKGPHSPPTGTDKARRCEPAGAEPVLGWRPALGQSVPGTDWVIESKLGEGGFGEVWLAYHARLKGRRVFKFCFQADRARSLKREITLFRLLRDRLGTHPHIVGIHDVYLDAPPYYLVMDHAQDGDLKSWFETRGGNISLATRLEIIAQAADALEAAHQCRVIHRDVKPSNILMFPPGSAAVHVKLTDFGIGQVVSAEVLAGLTRFGFTQTLFSPGSPGHAGTLLYMAPEIIARRLASVRSDIYSLGVVLYQLLVGDFTRPLTVDWSREIDDPLLREDLLRCFAGNPEDRFGSAAELATNLRSFEQRRAALPKIKAGPAERETRRRRSPHPATGLLELQRAEGFFNSGDSATAMVYLARILRQQPTNRAAAERLLAALSYRNFALPATPALSHGGEVRSVQFSPDGRRVVTASQDDTARVWDAQTGQPIGEPMRHAFFVVSAQFSPDGKRIVTASDDGSARVWDAHTGALLTYPLKHSSRVRYAHFSPNGRHVVTASHDGNAIVWSARDGRKIIATFSHEDDVRLARFSPSGAEVVTASCDNSARVWTVKTGRPVTPPLKHRGAVLSARFSPDGTRIVTASEDKTARVWNARNGEPLTAPLKHNSVVHAAGFSPDGQCIVTASEDDGAWVWDAKTGQALTRGIRHSAAVLAAEFSPEGLRLVTVSEDNNARVWNAWTGEPLTEPLKHESGVLAAQFSPDGLHVATASRDNTARIWDVRVGQMVPLRMGHRARVSAARFSRSGFHVATGSEDGTARVWNPLTGQPLTPPLVHVGAVSAIDFNRDGTRLATGSADKTARVWEIATGRAVLASPEHDAALTGLEFSPDDAAILTRPADKQIRISDARTFQSRGHSPRHGSAISAACFSPDSRRVVTASADWTACVWDAQTGEQLVEPLKHQDCVTCAQFSPEGKRIVTSSSDRTARVWDATTGKAITKPMKHTDRVLWAQFSPNGASVVTASRDHTARLWNARTGEPLTEPLRHADRVVYAEFSPDGERVVTASWDKTVRVWNAHTGHPYTEPLRHDTALTSARFSPGGRWVLTVASDDAARLWELPQVAGAIPRWLPDLAEVIAGQRFSQEKVLESVSTQEFFEFKGRLTAPLGQDDCSQWVRWFLADRSLRPLSPSAKCTVADYVTRRAEENNTSSLLEAVQLAPDNAVALARLARDLLTLDPAQNPRQALEADWLCRHAVALAPHDREVAEVRATIDAFFSTQAALANRFSYTIRSTVSDPERV